MKLDFVRVLLLKEKMVLVIGYLPFGIAACRIIEPETPADGKNVGRRHRQTVTAVALSEDDSKGFAASKDGLIVHWDVETGSSDKYNWPSNVVNRAVLGAKGKKKQGSRNILALAVSSDGRYLATGGLDRTIHLWDTRTREHLQVGYLCTSSQKDFSILLL